MKRTTTANIGGMVFNIDEDAYALLDRYLRDLGRQFAKSAGPDADTTDTTDDIEARVAELLTDRLAGRRQVVTADDVRWVELTIGRPEEIAGDEPAAGAKTGADKTGGKQGHKDFRRHTTDRVVGGVASGLARAIGVDAWVVRCAFVALAFCMGAGVVAYAAMWAFVPDDLGRKVTIDGKDIETNIREGFDDARGSIGQAFGGAAGGDLVRGCVKAGVWVASGILAVLTVAGAVWFIGLALSVMGQATGGLEGLMEGLGAQLQSIEWAWQGWSPLMRLVGILAAALALALLLWAVTSAARAIAGRRGGCAGLLVSLLLFALLAAAALAVLNGQLALGI